ncbi:DUF3558 domain-containing protein [Amycolatopsis lurida]
MNSQRLVGLTTAVLAAGALLAGCGGGKEGSAGDIPTATVPGGKPPASGSPSGEESPAPGGSTGSAPKVSSPIDTEKFTGDVCATLSPAALSELGLGTGTPRQAATGPSCSWKFTEEDTNRVEIAAQEKNPNGLSDIYDQKDEFGYFEPLEVGGHPAVFASQTDQRASGSCGLYIGLNDQFAAFVSVRIGSGPDKSQPCPVVEKTAEAMIDTVKGG